MMIAIKGEGKMKSMMMRVINFMKLNDDEHVEIDDNSSAVSTILKSVIEIGVCLGLCLCIFMLPLCIRF